MSRANRGLLVGGLMGLLAAVLLSSGSYTRGALVAMAPGAILLGGLLGWNASRFRRFRLLKSVGFGVVCAFANGPVASLVNLLLGDPLNLKWFAKHQANPVVAAATLGLTGDVIMAVPLLIIGVLAGVAVTLATIQLRRRAPAVAQLPSASG